MKSAIYVKLMEEEPYDKNSKFTKIRDSLKTNLVLLEDIMELKARVKHVVIPANLNKDAYKFNMYRSLRKYKDDNAILCPEGMRSLDFEIINENQKKFLAYAIVESLKVILFKSGKSIRTAKILVDDVCSKEGRFVIEELSKEARNIIVLTEKMNRFERLREYILYNYGVALEYIDREKEIKDIDFIISLSRKDYELNKVWYYDNTFSPVNSGVYVNKVGFKVPWKSMIQYYSPELLGGIVEIKKNESIKDVLLKNDIVLEKISFNNTDIVI